MRSIAALLVALAALLIGIGPERGPVSPASRLCEGNEEVVCLENGRLEVSVRGAVGRVLGDAAAGFSFADGEDLDLVVRIEPGSLEEAEGAGPTADRVFIGSLSQREMWVEVKDTEIDRTRVYFRAAGSGWGLVDTVPRRRAVEPVERLALLQ